jgi:hypothetical protein
MIASLTTSAHHNALENQSATLDPPERFPQIANAKAHPLLGSRRWAHRAEHTPRKQDRLERGIFPLKRGVV